MVDIQVEAIVAPARPMACASGGYTSDTTPSKLLTIALNLDDNTDHMSMIFDETVDHDSYVPDRFIVHSTANGGTKYPLTGGSVVTADGPAMKVVLSKADRDQIKLLADLAT